MSRKHVTRQLGRIVVLGLLIQLAVVVCGGASPALATLEPNYGHWVGYGKRVIHEEPSPSGAGREEEAETISTIEGAPKGGRPLVEIDPQGPETLGWHMPNSYHEEADSFYPVEEACTITVMDSPKEPVEYQENGVYVTAWAAKAPTRPGAYEVTGQQQARITQTVVYGGVEGCPHETDVYPNEFSGGAFESNNESETSEFSRYGQDPEHLHGTFIQSCIHLTPESCGYGPSYTITDTWDVHLVGVADTDGDGVDDYIEFINGTDPLDPHSTPPPGSPGVPPKAGGGEEGNGKEKGGKKGGGGEEPPPNCNLLGTCPPTESPIYMALGDSYSSGEGACPKLEDCKFDYITGTDVENVDQCHRSIYSYPQRTDLRDPLDPYYYDRACSGAVIHNLYGAQNREGHVQVDEGFQLNYLEKAEAEPNEYVKTVSIGIGGNDAEFSNVISACVISHYVGSHKVAMEALLDAVAGDSPAGVFAEYELGKIPTHCKGHVKLPSFSTIKGELEKVYRRIAELAPVATIYVMGYPKLFAEHPHQTHTSSRILGTCDVNSGDAEWLNGKTVRFDKTIQEAVKLAHVKAIFVDQADAFRNHELCRKSGSNLYMQGFHPAVRNGKGFHVESFHPNDKGQEQFAKDLDECAAVEAAALVSGYCKPKHP